jgi:hypothetical protein
MDFLASYTKEDLPAVFKTIGIYFLFWNLLNIIAMYVPLPDKHLKREDMLDFRNRLISIIHGVAILLLSAYNTYFLHS